jgi:hypothetical protein
MNMEAETEHKSLPSSEQGLPKIEGEETLADGSTIFC